MSLEVNKNDQAINAKKLPKAKEKIKRGVAGVLTTLMLFSGSILGAQEAHATEYTEPPSYSQTLNNVDPNTVIEIPEAYRYEVSHACGKESTDEITIDDLANFNDNYFSLSISDDSSLEWLNYINGTESIYIHIHTADTSVFKSIEELKGFKTLYLSTWNNIELNDEDFKFLKNSPDITKLSLYGLIPEPGVIENLTHLKELHLHTDGNYKVDFKKLTFLDKLEFPAAGPYDVAIDLTADEYYELTNNGVEIAFDEPEHAAIYEKINEELDEIISSFNLPENATEQEKLDAILIYVLDTLTYDPEISEALRTNTEHSDLTKSFYVDGNLYGALEKDTAICGNYTALTNALAERLGLNTFSVLSENHAWSLVEVEGKQYYVDSTWLDGQSVLMQSETTYIKDDEGNIIGSSTEYTPVEAVDLLKKGQTEDLNWYMEDPESYPISETQKESHIAINLPSFYNLNPQEAVPEENNPEVTQTTKPIEDVSEFFEEAKEESPINLDEEKFGVKIGNKTWIIGGAAAIGILGAFGGAVAAKKHKDKKERERRRRQQMYNDFGFSDFGSTPYNSYGNPYNQYNSYNSSNTSRRGRR